MHPGSVSGDSALPAPHLYEAEMWLLKTDPERQRLSILSIVKLK